MIEINKETFNRLKMQGKAGNVKGAYWMNVSSIHPKGITFLTPVKIIGQVNYKGKRPNSFKPVKIEGL